MKTGNTVPSAYMFALHDTLGVYFVMPWARNDANHVIGLYQESRTLADAVPHVEVLVCRYDRQLI